MKSDQPSAISFQLSCNGVGTLWIEAEFFCGRCCALRIELPITREARQRRRRNRFRGDLEKVAEMLPVIAAAETIRTQ
jgi:hypothetical protein